MDHKIGLRRAAVTAIFSASFLQARRSKLAESFPVHVKSPPTVHVYPNPRRRRDRSRPPNPPQDPPAHLGVNHITRRLSPGRVRRLTPEPSPAERRRIAFDLRRAVRPRRSCGSPERARLQDKKSVRRKQSSSFSQHIHTGTHIYTLLVKDCRSPQAREPCAWDLGMVLAIRRTVSPP